MADRFAAEIEIGGPVPASLMDELLDAVHHDGASFEWGDGFAGTTEELIESVREGGTLWLCDDQATYGEFSSLEELLVRHSIAFDRRCDAGSECDPELVRFRPGMSKPDCRNTSMDGCEIVEVSRLCYVLDALKRGDASTAYLLLQDVLGPVIPPLEPFYVVGDV